MARTRRILRAAQANAASLSFSELKTLIVAAGFELARVAGSHHVYKKTGVAEIVNVQPIGNRAKPYQVRQILELIDKYRIAIK